MGAGAEAVLQVVLKLRNQMREELTGVQGQLQGLASKAALVGAGLTAGVTLPLVGIAKQAIQTAGAFESQMNVLTVAARASGTSLEDLSQAALLVGKDTQLVGINSAQAADAMTNFYKAGLDTADIFGGRLNNYLQTGTNLTGALRSAVDLAAASELDLNQASMLTASSMATFGLAATDTTRIANAFVGAADASLASVGDLAAAMENIGPTAAAFGWSIEETNTALAILSTRGILGAEAGTALKSMMTNLMSPTKDTRAALAALNVALYDSQGNMLPLPNIIGQLSKSMAGMTEEQRNQYVQTLAGTYGMKAMNTLLAEGVPGWENMAQAVADAATAAEVGAARTQGLQAAWEQLQGALETLYITVGLPLIQNFLTPLVQKVTDIISGLVELNPNVQKAAIAFAAALAAAGPVALIISGIATALAFLISPLGLVITGIAALAAAFAGDFMGIRTRIETVSGHIRNFVAVVQDAGLLSSEAWEAMTLLMSEHMASLVQTVGAALAVLKAAFTGDFEAIRSQFVIFQKAIDATFGAGTTAKLLALGRDARIMFDELRAQVQIVQTAFAVFRAALTGEFDGIRAQFPEFQRGIDATFGAGTTAKLLAFGRDVGIAFETVKRTVGNTLEGLLVQVLGTLPEIGAAVLTTFGEIGAFLGRHASEIQTVISTAWSFISGLIQNQITLISSLILGGLALLRGDWQAAWEFLAQAVEAKFGAIIGFVTGGTVSIRDVFVQALPAVTTIVQQVFGTVQTTIQTILQDVVPAVSGSIGQIVQTFVTLLPKIQSTVVTIFGTVQTTIQTILQDVVPAVSGYVGQIVQAFVNVLPQILDTVSLVFDSLRLVIETALRSVLPILISFVQDAVNTFAHLLPQIITTVSGILNGLANVVNSILGVISQFVANHGEDIQTFFTQAWQQIQRIISMALEIINATIVPLLNGIAQFIRTHSDDIQAILGALWSSVTAVIQGALRIIEDVVRTVLAVIKGDWQTAWESVVDIAVTIFQTIAKVLGDAYDFLNALTGGWIGKIIQWFQDLYHKLVGGSIIPDMVREILSWFTRLGSEIGKTVVAIKDEMVKRWEEIKTAIGREVNNILTNVGKFLDDVRNKIRGYDLKGAATTAFQTVVAGISEKAAQALTNVGKFLTDAAAKIKGYSFKSATLQAVQTVVSGILEKMAVILTTIGSLLTNIQTKISGFSLAGAGAALIEGFIGGVRSKAGDLVAAASGVVSNAIQAAKNLLGIKSPSKVFEEIGINVVEGLIVGIDEKKAEAAKRVAEAVADIIQAAVGAAEALRAFQPVDDLGVVTEQIKAFLIGAEAQFADLIAQTDEKLAKQAELFGQAAGAVVELVGNAVEVLNRLRDYEMLHGLQAAINNIAHWIKQMAHTMAAIATEVDTDAQEAARALAEAAGPVVDIFGGALETIESIGQWKGLHGLQGNINNIAHWIKMLTHTMAAIATEIADDGLAAAKAFADAAGPVVDTFGGALETIESIGQWKGLHGLQGNINNIAHWLRVIVQTLGVVGQIVGVELQAAARTFAENVGPVVGMIEGGLKGIAALATFDTFLDAGQFISNLGVFATMLNILTARLAQAADQLSDETRAAAAKFAAHIGPVTKDIETGLKGIAALATFDTFLDAGKFISNIDVFRTMLNILTAKLAEVADRISDETRAAARRFAENIGPITKDLETGLKGVAALATFDTFLDGGRFIANLDVFTTLINILAGKLAAAADRLTDETRARAKAFAESAAAITGSTKEGLATLVSLAQEGVTQAEGFAVAAEDIGAALARGMAVLQGAPDGGPLSLIEVMAQLVRAVGSAVALIRASFDELVGAAYGAGYDWAAQLADGIRAGVPLVTAAVQAVADLFPHSPAKAGPLRRAPDWRKFLLGGLLPVAGEVGRALAGVGAGVGTPATFGALPVGGPAVAPVAISSGGATVIKFTYAPALSLASQREAEEQIAPVLARVLAREGRRR